MQAPAATSQWYEALTKDMGGEAGTIDFARLFMVPGMGHCGGGPGVNGFDQIGTLERWVEQGIAPNSIIGTGANGLTRPLCAYPQAAEHKGGDLKDAANWSCQAPR